LWGGASAPRAELPLGLALKVYHQAEPKSLCENPETPPRSYDL